MYVAAKIPVAMVTTYLLMDLFHEFYIYLLQAV